MKCLIKCMIGCCKGEYFRTYNNGTTIDKSSAHVYSKEEVLQLSDYTKRGLKSGQYKLVLVNEK